MAITTVYKNKMVELTKLFDRARVHTGTINKTTLSGLTNRGEPVGLNFPYSPTGGAITSNILTFNVPAGDPPNILKLFKQNGNILKLGGTKTEKVYIEDYSDIMGALDGENKEYIVGAKRFGATVYPFVLYPISQGDFNEVSANELSPVTAIDDVESNVYMAFASTHAQWVGEDRSDFSKVEIDVGYATVRYLVRHQAYFGYSLDKSLTYQAETNDDLIAMDLTKFAPSPFVFPVDSRIITRVQHKLEEGLI